MINCTTDHAIRTTITLYPDDLAIARQVAEEVGSRSLSAGLRAIIAFYRRNTDQPTPAPTKT